MSSKKNLFVLLVIAPLLGISLALVRIYYVINVWKYTGEERLFEIRPGEGFSSINYRLKKEGLISSEKMFYRYNKFKGHITSFRSGRFAVPPDTNMLALIDIFLKGKPILDAITIPEGKNMYEIAALLEQTQICKKSEFLKVAKNPDFVASLGIPAETIEGYLYPDTYQFDKNISPEVVIKNMLGQFKKVTADFDLSDRGLSLHQLVILASMVEKETGAKHERPAIAGVFQNRLNKRMRLESDPTTIYGIWEQYTGNLRKIHLQEKTPYNTYKISGLPIGPIANPGKAALEAALAPAKHDYLFFVSQNDGTHVFTTNYKDHQKAVETWQINRANRQGKSWRDLNQQQ